MRNLNFLKLFYGLMLVMVSTAFVSCVDDNDDTEAPYLEVSPTTLIFGLDGQPASGSQASFDISTNRSWKATVKDDKSWVTLSKYYFQNKPVIDILTSSFLVTAKLAGIAYILAVALGVVVGVVAAVNHGKWVDSVLMTISVFGISAPAFWIAIILQIVICLKFNLLPLSGIDSFKSFILPGIALGTRYAASIARITRTSMLDVLSQDYIRTAEAKGLKGWVVTIKHALRNALIPIITIAGSDLGNILTGSVLVESVFSIPGIGKMLVDSINTRDLPIVQGGVMYIAVICVIMYLVVDLLYTVVDPRIRLGKESS